MLDLNYEDDRAEYFNEKYKICLCNKGAFVTEKHKDYDGETGMTKFNVNMECPACHKKNNVDFLVKL